MTAFKIYSECLAVIELNIIERGFGKDYVAQITFVEFTIDESRIGKISSHKIAKNEFATFIGTWRKSIFGIIYFLKNLVFKIFFLHSFKQVTSSGPMLLSQGYSKVS